MKNYKFNTIEGATAEVNRQVAMNKALKQMLLAVALLAIIFLHLSLTGCSSMEAPQYNEEEIAAIQEDVANKNPIFVNIGDDVTIGGVTYNASVIIGTKPDGIISKEDRYYFVLNRVNNHVLLFYATDHSSSSSHSMIDTGLIFEGPVYINGIEIPPLAQN